jgi:hypothetical protein
MTHGVPHLLLRDLLKMRTRAFKVYDLMSWNNLYHEEHGTFLHMKHRKPEVDA